MKSVNAIAVSHPVTVSRLKNLRERGGCLQGSNISEVTVAG